MEKVIKALFNEGESTVCIRKGMSRYNYGQILQVEGLALPDGHIEVDFSLTEVEGEASTYIGTVKDGIITINIPDFIFQKENTFNLSSYDAYAFIYQSDGESGRTIKKIILSIQARPKRTTEVPEDQKDPFLEEVRKVMRETKDIAQSVRDDADAGEFDGEQGPKGDAGSIQFKIVPTLPTEDIDTSIMYLVPSPTEEDENRYLEYVYIDGKPEIVGSASVQVNPDEFVKKDDYASETNAGLIKIAKAHGFVVDGTGNLVADVANDNEINNKTSNQMLKVYQIDKIVKSGLVNCKEEWTDEQKQLARALLGVLTATDNRVGMVKGGGNCGTSIHDATGTIRIDKAGLKNIDGKTDNYKPIVPSTLDYAVKKALSDCKLEGDDVWTEEEKAKALKLLGGVPKFDGSKETGDLRFTVYGQRLGEQIQRPTSSSPKEGALAEYGIGNTLQTELVRNDLDCANKKYVDDGFAGAGTVTAGKAPQYTTDGNIAVGKAKYGYEAVSKSYVDDLVGSVESILTELHAHAESLIGGEA